ncbi:phage late control D family protein [Ochrobactrum sp. MR28]|nr:phage late control D family protein [Ochrobactrum sp. MR28]MBX8818945.1 phage late control D family protein [Ochrobactrum sp. MR31]
MKPLVEVTVDGKPVANAFYERLISLSVTDKEGVSSDTFQIELNDGPPSFLAIPRKGAKVTIKIDDGSGMRSLGIFTVDKVTAKCLPYGLSISGKAADLRSGKLKENRERHWDKARLKDIVEEVAKESNLKVAIDEDIGSFEYGWIAQQDESNIHFLERLASRHNALFAIKNGCIVFTSKGSGQTASGKPAGTVIIDPKIVIQGSCSFEANDRTKYKKVVAYYQDRDKAERVELGVDADADGDSVLRLPEPYSSPDEADKAAEAKAKALKRGEGAASVTVIGSTAICAGLPLLFQSIRPGFDGVPYVIDTATHTYTKTNGYQTQISAKLYDGQSAGDGKGKKKKTVTTGQASQSEETAKSDNKVAPDAPAGTPATPSGWSEFKRNYGLADYN